MDIDSQTSRGFGFVIYKNDHGMQECLNQSEHELKGKKIECKPALLREEIKKSDSIKRENSQKGTSKKGSIKEDSTDGDFKLPQKKKSVIGSKFARQNTLGGEPAPIVICMGYLFYY